MGCNIDIGNPFIPTQPILDELEEDSYFEGICQLKGAFFIFTENDFDGGNTDSGAIGCRIRSTKSADNSFVHRNWFDNLDYANKADGQNIEGTEVAGSYSGLRYTCQYNGESLANGYDFEVNEFTSDLLTDISGLQQGLEWNPLDVPEDGTNDELFAASPAAGSSFSDANDPEHISDFWNNGDHPIQYKRHSSDDLPVINGVSGGGVIETNIDNFCDAIVELLPDGTGLVQQIQVDKWEDWREWSKPQLLANMYLQEALIDGGNTNDVIDDIDWGTDTTLERDKLLAQSPHLSTDVLRAVADNTSLFPHPVALEIFVANPDILRDNRFIAYLGEKADPMPDYMIDLLIASRDQATIRTTLMRQYGILSSIYGRSTALLGRTILRNLDSDKSSILFMADEVDCLVCEFRLIQELLDAGFTSQGQERFEDIISRIPLNDESSRAEYDAFEMYLNLRVDMISGGNTWQSITSSQLSTLCDVSAAFTTWAGVQAVGILNAYFNKNHIIPPAFKNEWSIRRLNGAFQNEPLELFPNPADGSLTIKFDTVRSSRQGEVVTVYDTSLREVQRFAPPEESPFVILNTGNWAEGMYIVEVRDGRVLIGRGRFHVIH